MELWRAVTDTVKPLSSKTPAKKAAHVSLRKKLTVDVKPVRHTPDFDYSVTEKLTEGDIHAMDKKTGQRFRNGEMPIEAVLDLHGYTLESGFDALVKFVYAQEKRGARCLLLITGKGGFLGRGVIRAGNPQSDFVLLSGKAKGRRRRSLLYPFKTPPFVIRQSAII